MTDKGFKIEKKAGNVGPEIKCPSFCISRMPNEPRQCSPVQRGKMAKDRIHVERTINQKTQFKLVSRRIPVSLFGNLN